MEYQVSPTHSDSPPKKKYSALQYDIEKQEQGKEELPKNNKKLYQLCKKICLIFGWSLVVCLFVHLLINIYIILHDFVN